MNSVMLIGRLTSEPDVKQGQYGAVVHYNLAVDRGKNKQTGETETDFPRCVCFGKSAEFAMNYLHKGMKIAVEGFLKTGSYQVQDSGCPGGSRTVYTTEVQVRKHEFCEKRSDAQIASDQPRSQSYPQQQNYPPQNNYRPNGSGYQQQYQPQQYQQAPQQYQQQNNYQPNGSGYRMPNGQQQYAAPPLPSQQPMPQGFEEVISDQPLPF